MLPRTAPPASAVAIAKMPNDSGLDISHLLNTSLSSLFWKGETTGQGLAREDCQKGDAFEDRDRRIREFVLTLQDAAAREHGTEHDRHDQDSRRGLPGEEGDQDAHIAVAGRGRLAGPAMDRRN